MSSPAVDSEEDTACTSAICSGGSPIHSHSCELCISFSVWAIRREDWSWITDSVDAILPHASAKHCPTIPIQRPAMGVGAVLEPLVVVTLLASGVIINRDQTWSVLGARRSSSIKWFAGRVLRMKTVDDEDVYNLESGSRWVVNGGHREGSLRDSKSSDEEVAGSGSWSWKEEASGSLLEDVNGTSQLPRRRERTLRLFGWERTITTPNTEVFRDRAISRLLRRFPFLVEAWYWALIYWVGLWTLY